MTKLQWLEKQIKAASEGFDDLSAPFIKELVTAVKEAGENLTRLQFQELFESFSPDDHDDHCEYMMLDTQLSYAADYSEAWPPSKAPLLPEISFVADSQGTRLPDDFVKLGGSPDWIHDESFPICKKCDQDMSLFAQFKSINDDKLPKEFSCYHFGDAGNLYLFTCTDCNTYTTEQECY